MCVLQEQRKVFRCVTQFISKLYEFFLFFFQLRRVALWILHIKSMHIYELYAVVNEQYICAHSAASVLECGYGPYKWFL